MSSNGQTRRTPTIGRDAVVRTRVIAGFETVGHAVTEAKAFRKTRAFYRTGNGE